MNYHPDDPRYYNTYEVMCEACGGQGVEEVYMGYGNVDCIDCSVCEGHGYLEKHIASMEPPSVEGVENLGLF